MNCNSVSYTQTNLSAPLLSNKSFPSSSLTITDIRFLVLLNSKTFNSLYVLHQQKLILQYGQNVAKSIYVYALILYFLNPNMRLRVLLVLKRVLHSIFYAYSKEFFLQSLQACNKDAVR